MDQVAALIGEHGDFFLLRRDRRGELVLRPAGDVEVYRDHPDAGRQERDDLFERPGPARRFDHPHDAERRSRCGEGGDEAATREPHRYTLASSHGKSSTHSWPSSVTMNVCPRKMP